MMRISFCPSIGDSPLTTLLSLVVVAIYNTLIAGFLTIIGTDSFQLNLLYSQCIGYGISLAYLPICLLRCRTSPQWQDALLAIPIGAAAGFSMATWLAGMTLRDIFTFHQRELVGALVTALVFGVIAAYYYSSRVRLQLAEADLQQERLLRQERESQALALAAQAELKVLQAQIEPHFLFNTLAVVVELIESDPVGARGMLLDLVAMLRASLAATRQPEIALGEELRVLRAYLDIMQRRMGPRLRYRIEASPELGMVRVPPLLLQPLVENAVRHGIEPKADGGEIVVTCLARGAMLVMTVSDTGCGIGQANGPAGVGLGNVRARLANAYGSTARLTLGEQAGGGMVACLELPLCAAGKEREHAPLDCR